MFCPNCGTQNPDTAPTCSKCNFQMKGAAAPKFKGTMLMNQPAQPVRVPTPPRPVPAPPPPAYPAPQQQAPAPAAAAPPSKLKGTMVGVGFPGMGPATPAPMGYPGAAPSPYGAPPAAPSPYGQPGAPMGNPQTGGFAAAPSQGAYQPPPAQSPYAPPAGGYAPPADPALPFGATVVDSSPFGDNPPANPALGAPLPFPNTGGFPQSSQNAPPGGYGPPGGPPQGPQGMGMGGPPQYGSPVPFGSDPQGAPQGAYGQGAPFGAPPGQMGAPPGQAYDPTVPYGSGAPMGAPPATAPGASPAAMQVVPPQGGPMMAPVVPAAPGVHGAKGTVRSGFLCLVLGFVTLGIYQFIWFIKTCNEMSTFLQRDEPSWIKITALSIVTCGFYAMYWMLFKCGALVQECQLRAGVQSPQNHGWLYLVPYYNVVLLTEELNKAWQGPA